MLVGGFEVHIGLNSDYSENSKCAGGPYLVCNGCIRDADTWPGGFEAWCGLKGEYVSIVRDSSAGHLEDDVRICTLGIIAGGQELIVH